MRTGTEGRDMPERVVRVARAAEAGVPQLQVIRREHSRRAPNAADAAARGPSLARKFVPTQVPSMHTQPIAHLGPVQGDQTRLAANLGRNVVVRGLQARRVHAHGHAQGSDDVEAASGEHGGTADEIEEDLRGTSPGPRRHERPREGLGKRLGRASGAVFARVSDPFRALDSIP